MSKPITKKNREHLDSLVIGSGHTIMAGYIPTSIEPQTFSENFYKWAQTSKESVSQFGFWGGEIDYNTYYPDLKPEELLLKMRSLLNQCSDYYLQLLCLRTGILPILVKMEY